MDTLRPLDSGKTVYRVRRWDRSSDYEGQKLEVGELVNLVNAPNDPLLIRFGYFEPWSGAADDIRQCGECGKSFDSDRARTEHGARAHRPRPEMDADLEDQEIDREFTRLERSAPFLNVGRQDAVDLDRLPNNTLPVVSAEKAPEGDGPAIDATQITRDLMLQGQRQSLPPALDESELPPVAEEILDAQKAEAERDTSDEKTVVRGNEVISPNEAVEREAAPPEEAEDPADDEKTVEKNDELYSPNEVEAGVPQEEAAEGSEAQTNDTGDTPADESPESADPTIVTDASAEDAPEETPKPRTRRSRAAADSADASDV